MSPRRNVRWSILAAAVLATAAIGCGSSDDESRSAAATTGGESQTAVGEPIKLGSISSCGGALASGLGGTCATIEAWAADVNARGGINGHPVELTVIDDQGIPEKGVAAAKKLVEQEKVQAIVGGYSVTDPAWADYVREKGVPVVGGGSAEPAFTTNPMFFPSGSQVPAFMYAQAVTAKKLGKNKLGMLYCAEAPTCATQAPLTKQMIKDGLLPGQELVHEGKISATQPSFTAACLAAKDAGVDALLVSHAGAIAERVVDECAKQGYRPLIMSGSGVLNTKLAKNPNWEGAINTQNNVPLSVTDNAANQRLLEALGMYAPDITPDKEQYNASITGSWSGGLLYEAAAKAGDLGPDSTPAEVVDALHSLKDETLDGFYAPLNFQPGELYQANCAYIESVKDGKPTTEVHGSEPICIPGDASKYLRMLAGS